MGGIGEMGHSKERKSVSWASKACFCSSTYLISPSLGLSCWCRFNQKNPGSSLWNALLKVVCLKIIPQKDGSTQTKSVRCGPIDTAISNSPRKDGLINGKHDEIRVTGPPCWKLEGRRAKVDSAPECMANTEGLKSTRDGPSRLFLFISWSMPWRFCVFGLNSGQLLYNMGKTKS